MFTLTKASIETKLILKWMAISFVGLIVLIMLFRLAISIKNSLFPAPPPKPTVSFGQLPVVLFPQSVTEDKFTYSINTVSGDLPSFDSLARVYRIAYNPPDLLALQKAQNMVKPLDFNSKPYAISNQLYEWVANDTVQRHLRMNILNYNFTVTASLLADPYILSATNLPTEQNAVQYVKGRLDSMGVFYNDIDETKTKTTLLNLNNNNFAPATSFSNAQFIRIDFFQKDVNDLPIYYEQPNNSTLNVLVSGGKNGPQIVGVNYIYQTPSSDFSTYPLKTVQQAYSELASGSAYIASYFGTSKNIQIKNVSLAYYLGSTPQDFLIPIYVFQGNDGFYAYVSAVRDEWISK